MSQGRQPEMERLLNLLADEAVQPLPHAERAELEGLLARHPGVDPECMERAAAAVSLAVATPASDPIPEALRRRLLAAAESAGAGGGSLKFADFTSRGDERPGVFRRPEWLAAAAALALFSGSLFWGLTTVSRLRSESLRARESALEARAQAAAAEAQAAEARRELASALADLDLANQRIAQLIPPDPEQARAMRQRLLDEAHDVVTVNWQSWDNPAMVGVAGDVVWSDQRQVGFLRFTGLPRNDPSQSQYQLWIVDGTRGMEQRISGGVFDISREGEVIIPIDPGLAVKTAAAFAVTVEQPTGTWVSDMGRKAVIAAVER